MSSENLGRPRGAKDRQPRKMALRSLQNFDAGRPEGAGYPSRVIRTAAPPPALKWWASLSPKDRAWWVAHAYAHRHLTGQEVGEEE